MALGVGNPRHVLNLQRLEKHLLSEARRILVDRFGEDYGKKICADVVVGEMRSRHIVHRPLKHPTPYRIDLDSCPVVLSHIEASRHSEKIAHRDVPYARIDRAFRGFGKNISQPLIEPQISRIYGDAYQDRKQTLR